MDHFFRAGHVGLVYAGTDARFVCARDAHGAELRRAVGQLGEIALRAFQLAVGVEVQRGRDLAQLRELRLCKPQLAQLLRRDSYGYEINKTVRELSGGRYELKEATLYTAFKRLEETGQIMSYWGSEATGARRRYYRIPPAGREAYHEQVGVWEATKEIIDRLIAMEEES